MRQIAKDKQISIKSISEVRQHMRIAAESLADRHGLRAPDGKAITTSYLINYLMCDYLTAPAAEQDRRALRGKSEFDRHLTADAPIPFAGPVSASGPDAQGGVTAAKPPEPRPPQGISHPGRGHRNGGTKPRKQG